MRLLLIPLVGLPALSSGAQPTVVVGRSCVLNGEAAKKLFKQCSRVSPEGVQSYWSPNASELQAMNTGLAAFLQSQKINGRRSASVFGNYWHQCAGFTRGGKKFIYVNAFSPGSKKQLEDIMRYRERSSKEKIKHWIWTRDPMIVCDGGESYFGVEYEVGTKKFSNLAFNGAI